MRVLYVLSALNLADGILTALWIRSLPHLEGNPIFRALVETYGVTGSLVLKAALSGVLVMRAATGRRPPAWELLALRTLAWVYGWTVLRQIPIVWRLLEKAVL